MSRNQIALQQSDLEKLSKSLKMLHAVVRSPLLTDKYAKEHRKRMTQLEVKSANTNAFSVLEQCNVSEANADNFIDDLVESVHEFVLKIEKVE